MDIPKEFWRFYDLYRRKRITMREFSNMSGIQTKQIQFYLKEMEKDEKEMKKRVGGVIIKQ